MDRRTSHSPQAAGSIIFLPNTTIPNPNSIHGSSIVPLNPMPNPLPSTSSGSRSPPDEVAEDGRWAAKLLKDCAVAMSEKDSSKIRHLMWLLNELSSPYGDRDQKLASYYLQALFCKATDSGHRCYRTLVSAAEQSHSFESVRRLILRFQEVSPWMTFGHVASNGAMMDALEGESRIHVIDISSTLCTQWPTLLEALATRNDETPSLRLTVIATTNVVKAVLKEITPRMEKFARLMGVPFEFNVLTNISQLKELTKEGLGVRDGEAVAVNCIGALRRVDVDERGSVIEMIKTLGPKIATIVEEEANFSSNRDDFIACFDECLRFYTTYLDMLEASFGPTSNERLILERECSRSIIRVLSCDNEIDHGGDCERQEKGVQWSERLREAGFSTIGYSDDVVDDVKALLKRYRDGWSLVVPRDNDQCSGIYLAWQEEPVVWASVWKP